ncbi:sigma-54 dependent transcriptional regulator [soil metagenome]
MSSPDGSSLTVLIVDDEELLVGSCTQILAGEGYQVLSEARGKAGLETLRRRRPEIVLMDVMLPDVDGLDLLREVLEAAPETLVVMITGFATVDASVEAIRTGAYDYIPKPFTATQLRIVIGRAAQKVGLLRDNAELRGRLKRQGGFDTLVGTSEPIREVIELASRVAGTDASVFLSGESGTGKELVARAIHENSRRASRPFVAINCAALPDHLLESELFGHERGSFTGAAAQRVGLIESASGGTFFLDEISEMSPELQAKLLRVVQERVIRRVGGASEIPVDVRWISATNRDPEEAVREGVLRHDLLFRLNVVPIRLPPLRERRDDVPPLVQHFLRRYAERYGRGEPHFTPEAERVLRGHDWPGNVRELQNVVERVVSLGSSDQRIESADLPREVTGAGDGAGRPSAGSAAADLSFHEAKSEAVSLFEQEYLRNLLEHNEGNISQAARGAGIDRKTIHRMLNRYDIHARG